MARKKAQIPELHPTTIYSQRVVDGQEVACKKVIQACQRHLDDLNRNDLLFDEGSANRILLFANVLKHVKGRWSSPNIVLEPWQQFVLGSLFGWKRPDGLRRFRTAYIQIARKNGKSTLGAIVGLYMLLLDAEPGADVYSAATTRDQAKIIFNTAQSLARGQAFLRSRLGIQTHNIHDLETGSKFEALSADAHTLDGLNIHCALVDELHAHKDDSVWGVLETGTGARTQSLMLAITTAGFERSICIQQYGYAEQVLSGTVMDDSYFAFVTELDEGDDWTDPIAWKKANPNLGVSVKLDQLERLCKQAQEIPSRQNNFLCKHLNKWVNQADRWINLDDWKACEGQYTEESLYGRLCFGGLDLSATTDITAFCLLFPPEDSDEPWKAVYRFWVPEERIAKRAAGQMVDKVPFDAWRRDGHVLSTGGNAVDYEFIRAEILTLSQQFDIREIAYDPYNARETAIKLVDAGMDMVEFRQGARSFNGPMHRFEAMLLDRKFCHGNHPAMSWMANNMTVRYDANMNMAPDKKSAKDRIDGVVALLMALGRAIEQEDTSSVYETRGIISL